MCGVAGAIGAIDGGVVDAVKAADASQRHRGPDGQGFWTDRREGEIGKVAFAHRRLSILDLSEDAAQPMRDPATGCVMIFNGEIYNYPELREQLEAAGRTVQSTGDTEVVLKAYIEWGPEMVSRLAGMFAIAIWDPRTNRVLFARDRVGIKPLYYCEVDRPEGRVLLFASEIRALLATGLVERRLDKAGIASYLWQGFVYGPSTMIEGVRLLPAGTTMTVTPGAPASKPEPFWAWPRYHGGQYTPVSDLQQALERSVRGRLISDVPLGVFLSGGVDSSAVAAVATQINPGGVHTFNISFEESRFDEAQYAEAVAKQLGTKHQRIVITEDHFKSHLDEAFTGIDQPTFDGLNTYFVSRAVRDAGMTVALAGTGGDELFGGYTSFADLPNAARVAGYLSSVPQPLLRAMSSAVTRVKTGRPGALPPQTRWGKLGDVLSTEGELAAAYQVSYSLYTQSTLRYLMPDLAESGTAYGVPEERFAALMRSAQGRHVLDAISTLELQGFVSERLMRDTDAASMAVSLEVRVPLLDHDFVQAAAFTEPGLRYQPVRKKQLLRRIALERLDPKIFDRPKSGFTMPFEVWSRNTLRDDIRDVMHDGRLARSAGLHAPAVAKVWKAVDDEAPGMYWSRMWALYSLLRWCRDHRVTV